jgi:omega-6 fatty acid desaturase (delta-12 desaturase)
MNRYRGRADESARSSGLLNQRKDHVLSDTSAATWMARLAPYRQADDRRAIFEIIVTLAGFMGVWALMYWLLQYSVLASWALAPLAGTLLVRVFIIQHDCGHGSLFSSSKVNDRVGRLLGVLTLTPYDYWRRQHALHHATSGNLDRRGHGDITTLTVEEYRALGFWQRVGYRVYRHPLVLFVVGPSWLFMICHRLPLTAAMRGELNWSNTMATNLGIALLMGAMMYWLGPWNVLMVQLPAVACAASIGVWLFYVQHQFEDTHWSRADVWSREDAALHGSSFYDLPKPVMWLTGNIGIHQVHHLSSRIPFYRLPQVIADYPELAEVGRFTFLDSLGCIKLTLWDEVRNELISFRDFRLAQRKAV